MAQLINKGPKHEARKQEAEKRQAEYSALSVAEKIEILDKKFGKDMGAVKQRKKLAGKEPSKTVQKEIKKKKTEAVKKETTNKQEDPAKETEKT